MYAANLEYDLNNVFGMHPDVLRMYVGSRILYAEYDGIEFRDASWYQNPPASVRLMGEQIGLPKLDMPHTNKPTPKMITYCLRDTTIVLRWVRLVENDFKKIGVTLKRTLPATSLAYFHSVHGRTPSQPALKIGKQDIITFLRRGYYGGRTEVFRLKPVQGNVFCADVSSMYPHVMKQHVYPSPDTAEFTDTPNIEQDGCYLCRVEAPKMSRFPVLPIRYEGRTVFPIGTFTGVWTSPELLYARSKGYTIHAIYGVKYGAAYRPFTTTIDSLYAWKLAGHTRAKFIMNSLYGKFGESGSLLEIRGTQRREICDTPKHANVIWAAYVTAYARLELLGGLERVAANGGEVLYCDTDSCFYRADDCLMDDEPALGAWVSKGREDCFEAKAPKLYRFGNIYHAKGIPQTEALQYFIHGMASYTKPNRFRESIQRALSLNLWESRKRCTTFDYRKRKVLCDGRTIPLTLNQYMEN